MTKELGAEGEALAAAYLEKEDYTIIERNWYCGRGEIDIIAKVHDVWVFCEVKTRRSQSTQQAFMNITARKREKMIAAAQHYLHEHELEDVEWRIDAIGVAILKGGQDKIDHVEDALDW